MLSVKKNTIRFRIILRLSTVRDNDCRRSARWVVRRQHSFYFSEMAQFTSSQSMKGKLYKEMAELTVSKPKPQWKVEGPIRNWLELPSDVMSNILYRIGPIDILENAQKVCTTWCKICKDPAMWRVIHMKTTVGPFRQVWEICRHAVDRSQGQLVDISIVDVVNDQLLQYVAHRSSQLKRLEFVSRYRDLHWNWTQALKKFPMLEELNLYKIKISEEAIEAAGRCCPMLKNTESESRKLYVFAWRY
ncbi:unnamed protein product [Lactuca virosa]|uniref:F-box domain-containing protein n=1 Tax=Lactuca virosa TaxID=75947 RepID=A0AAU9P6S1_9ASTR|nr:unnamed protein product [Lactuca virosa]